MQVRGFITAAGKRWGWDPRRRSYCRCYCSLVLVLWWSGHTHALKTCVSGLWADDGTGRDTTACAGPDFRPPHRDRAQAPGNTTRHILQGGHHTATPKEWWAALCGVNCLSVRVAPGVPLCLARASLGTSCLVAAAGPRIAWQRRDCPVNYHRPSCYIVLLSKPVVGSSLKKMPYV